MHKQYLLFGTRKSECVNQLNNDCHIYKNPAQSQGRYRLLVRLCWIIWGCSGRQIPPKSELHRLKERLRRQETSSTEWLPIFASAREICRIAECEKGHNASNKGEIVKIAMFGAAAIIWTTREKPDFMRVYAA